MKALILAGVPAGAQKNVLNSFRGGQAHRYEWLREQYLRKPGTRMPGEITQHFTLVSDWSTDLRYSPQEVDATDAEAFLASAVAIIQWADGRL